MTSPRRPGPLSTGPIRPLSIDGSLRETRSVSDGSQSILSPSADSPVSSNDSPSLAPPSAGAFAANFESLPSPVSTPSTHSFPTFTPSQDSLSVPSIKFPPPSPGYPSPLSPSGHRRGPSVSFGSTPPSPSSPSFGQPHRRAPSISFSSPLSPSSANGGAQSSAFSAAGKRHGRIHSRNLSVFFPRPENAAATAIAEDEDEPVNSNIPTSPRRLEGFQFGNTPGAGSDVDAGTPTSPPPGMLNNRNIAKRRGHHHKHSVSHSFFSFMEPSTQSGPDMTSPETLPEASSPFISQGSSTNLAALGGLSEKTRRGSVALPRAYSGSAQGDLMTLARVYERELAVTFSILQFIVGASMWAAGQSRGSLACTGLGYWVVFDASSVALASNALPWLSLGDAKSTSTKEELRRPFGSRRLETTVSFSQAIYLLFSGVYVLKEAVEHFLLSSSEEEGHHHHRGDEGLNGISFPLTLLWLSLASVLFSNLYYRNHSRLVDATGSSLSDPSSALASVPFLRRLARPLLASVHKSTFTSRLLSNPFTLAPASFSIILLYAAYIADSTQHITLDMLISTLETVWTFSIAYPTAVALGKILLQTAPDRALPGSGGPMETFMRAMREIERHPAVVHLPAPHFWQLTLPRKQSLSSPLSSNPSSSTSLSSSTSSLSVASEAELVATVELHVRKDLSDADILAITKWATDKCSVALGRPRVGNVTISIVRG